MTQFPEVRLGEKRTYQLLIVARNANTSQSIVPFAAKEDPFMVKSDSHPSPPPSPKSQSSLIQQIFIELLLSPMPSKDLHMAGTLQSLKIMRFINRRPGLCPSSALRQLYYPAQGKNLS